MNKFVVKHESFKFVGYASGIILIYKDNLHIDSFHVHGGILDYSVFNKEVNEYLHYNN